MSSFQMISADEISLEQFFELHDQYEELIHDISESKGAKDGQSTLADLDYCRYEQIPELVGPLANPKQIMGLDMIETLVKWKLRHGKFRPSLMNLVLSNDPQAAQDIVAEALEAFEEGEGLIQTIKILTELRGIGPATASLLLAVHNPQHHIFFSDEAFYWLCCDGRKDAIRYNINEYVNLYGRARNLALRLGVSAMEIEKVAFVILKQAFGQAAPKGPQSPSSDFLSKKFNAALAAGKAACESIKSAKKQPLEKPGVSKKPNIKPITVKAVSTKRRTVSKADVTTSKKQQKATVPKPASAKRRITPESASGSAETGLRRSKRMRA